MPLQRPVSLPSFRFRSVSRAGFIVSGWVDEPAAYRLVDQDEVGEHPAANVVPGDHGAQRIRSRVLALGSVRWPDIHAGRGGRACRQLVRARSWRPVRRARQHGRASGAARQVR